MENAGTGQKIPPFQTGPNGRVFALVSFGVNLSLENSQNPF